MTAAGATLASPAHRPAAARAAAAIARSLPMLFIAAAIAYLLLPIAVIALFSFNDPIGRSNVAWRAFTLQYWLDPFGVPGLLDAVLTSLRIALASTFIATVLGTLIAAALVRHRFRGRAATDLFIFLPVATPEIILGASLLTLFVSIGQPPFFPLSELTILLAHIMFTISYVVITMKARLQGFDRQLEEAAMDLGANEWQTFARVTFPLILPGILAAALLGFALSIDDFVITNFTAGRTVTFPMYIWGAARIGIPVQVNVIGTAMFLGAVGVVVFVTLWQRWREGRLAAR